MEILGVKIDNLSRKETLEKIASFLGDDQFHQIATVGPEFILEAQKNAKYKEILNHCDLNVADGFGIKLAFWRYGKKLKSRMAGADLMLEMLKLAEDRGFGLFLACRKDGLSSFKETKEAILKIYPKLSINGANLDLEAKLPSELQAISYKLIFCNFGAPHQEIFLNSLKNGLPLYLSPENKDDAQFGQKDAKFIENNELRKERCRGIIGVAMGVGGSFDFLTDKVRRAPKILRQIGLEWFWRLIFQPWEQKIKRLKRIWRAVIIFSIKVIIKKKI